MSAQEGVPIVGDIIEIEHTDDYSATAPVWTHIAHTVDTIEPSANTESAEIRQHAEFQMDVAAVSAAWETTFSKKIVTGTAALTELGLIGSNQELLGHYDTRDGDATAEALRISVFATEADRDSGTIKYQLGFDDYLLLRGDGSIGVEEFSTVEMTLRSRTNPIRLDAGGTLGGGT